MSEFKVFQGTALDRKRCLWLLGQDMLVAHYLCLHSELASVHTYTSCLVFASPNCKEVTQMEITCLALCEQNQIFLGGLHPAV